MCLLVHVLGLPVFVVEVGVQVLVVVNPGGHHVRVLLVIRHARWLSKRTHLLTVEAVVVCHQGRISPKDMLAPKVGVRSALVHSRIGFKGLLNVQFVLLNGQFGQLWTGIFGQNCVEVTPHSKLFLIEAIVVHIFHREHVLGHQFTQHAFV